MNFFTLKSTNNGKNREITCVDEDISLGLRGDQIFHKVCDSIVLGIALSVVTDVYGTAAQGYAAVGRIRCQRRERTYAKFKGIPNRLYGCSDGARGIKIENEK